MLEISASRDDNYFRVEVCGVASFCFAELYVHVAMSGRSDPRWRCRCGSINGSVTSGISQCTINLGSMK